jgi:hypothetical protein
VDPEEDNYFDIEDRYLDAQLDKQSQKKTIWTNLALHAPDQLRQWLPLH